jgi:hypothetical protein
MPLGFLVALNFSPPWQGMGVAGRRGDIYVQTVMEQALSLRWNWRKYHFFRTWRFSANSIPCFFFP